MTTGRRYDRGVTETAARREREAAWAAKKEKLLAAAADGYPLPRLRKVAEELVREQVKYAAEASGSGNVELAVRHGLEVLMSDVEKVKEAGHVERA